MSLNLRPYPLFVLSYSYLSLPFFFFFFGYLHFYISIPLSLALLSILLKPSKAKKSLKNSPLVIKIDKNFFLLIVIFFIWVLSSGSGGFFFQNSDYFKHNAILNDLVTLHWPVTYSMQQPPEQLLYLIYYLAYYLPAAVVGKIFNFHVAEIFLMFWTYWGILLSLGWTILLTGRSSLSIALIFIFFSGLDTIGLQLLQHRWGGMNEHIEWWAQFWQFSSFTTLLYWVPQHFIPGLLLTTQISFLHSKLKERGLSLLLVALSIFWSPFVTIGLFPLLLCKIKEMRQYFTYNNFIVGGIIAFFMVAYFLCKLPEKNIDLIFSNQEFSFVFPRLVLFLFLEAFIWIFFIKESFKKYALFLSVLVCFKLGQYNDLVMRASIPSLVILTLGLIHFLEKKSSWIKKSIFIILFTLGTLTPLREMERTRRLIHQENLLPTSTIFIEPKYAVQYLGLAPNFFFKYLVTPSDEAVLIPPQLKRTIEEMSYAP